MSAGQVIENPLSGERITIRQTASQTGGTLLAWELELTPGGRVPASHVHPGQEEIFTVLAGRMRFRIGWRRRVAGPGDTVTIPPGTVHHFANAGPVPVLVAVQTRPALAMEDLLETAAALARDQYKTAQARPRLADLALFMRDFEREVAAPVLPGLLRLAARLVARLASSRRAGRRYRRLRA
jgi:quercetin dioxygenase-like cupin family protein